MQATENEVRPQVTLVNKLSHKPAVEGCRYFPPGPRLGYYIIRRYILIASLWLVHTAPTRTRQDSFVLSASAVWTSH